MNAMQGRGYIPSDCLPVGDERVMEILDGPNKYGEVTFFLYWNGTGEFTGPRGQIFLSNPAKHKADRVIDRRQYGQPIPPRGEL